MFRQTLAAEIPYKSMTVGSRTLALSGNKSKFASDSGMVADCCILIHLVAVEHEMNHVS